MRHSSPSCRVCTQLENDIGVISNRIDAPEEQGEPVSSGYLFDRVVRAHLIHNVATAHESVLIIDQLGYFPLFHWISKRC